MEELAAAYEKKTHTKVILEGGGATRGIRDSVALKIDLGGTCRMPLPDIDHTELFSSVFPVAWDALAVIVHPDNAIQNLTTAQVQAIYTGKVSNWKSLGGRDAPINLVVRSGKISGVGYAIRQYIFQDSDTEFVARYTVPSSGPLEKLIERDPNAVGITGVSSARKRNVKIIDFNGQTPTFVNVKNGKYGLIRPLYLVTGPSPTKKAMDFINFATTNEGREVLRKNGTVPYQDALSLVANKVIYGFGVK